MIVHRGLMALGLALASAGVGAAGWNYASETDPMTTKTTHQAQLESTNSLTLSFPYSGNNHGTLIVRSHPRYGVDVILMVDKGQIICHRSSNCTVGVRFDQGLVMRFAGTGPSDGSSTAIFLRPSDKFISSAKKSKRILVQATMYQAGEQLLEFDAPAPLAWPMKK